MIDGVCNRIDEASHLVRFTPRRKGSIWSASNTARARELIAQGRTRPAGMAAYETRSNRTPDIHSFEQAQPVSRACYLADLVRDGAC